MKKRRPITEHGVVSIIRRFGIFEINPLSTRDAAKRELLKDMTARGIVKPHRINAGRLMFTMTASKDKQEKQS